MPLENFIYDVDRAEAIADRFELRRPNKLAFFEALKALSGDFEPGNPIVLSLATGVGKTYIMAAIVEYLRESGITDCIIITPSAVVQAKTVANFTPGNRKFVEGALTHPKVITPDNYDRFRQQPEIFSMFGQQTDPIQLFILNIHQLTVTATKLPSERELSGNLKHYLTNKKDLVVLADEHHLYSLKAKAFRDGIMSLSPAAIIGLTASATEEDDVRYRYTLREAIDDQYVKRPVIAFRRGGYGEHEEEQQLRDALALLNIKQQAFESYCSANPDVPRISPVLFVQCADVNHATQTAALLRTKEYFGSDRAVLQVDNEHNDPDTIRRLSEIDSKYSEIRAVVSVNKLKEGWDVKNVAVMVTLRAMASDVLTQQTLGRGLRLPFGIITGVPHVDQLDVLAHESFTKMLKNEDVLREFGLDAIKTEPKSDAERQSETDSEAQPIAPVPPTADGIKEHDDSSLAAAENLTPEIALPSRGNGTTARLIDGGIGLVEIGDDDKITPPDEPHVVTVEMNDEFKDMAFYFPTTTIRPIERIFDLNEHIGPDDIDTAAKAVSDARAVLHRQELQFSSKRLRAVSSEDVRVGSIHITAGEAKAGLSDEVMDMRNFDPTTSNVADLRTRIVPRLVAKTGITEWSTKALASAKEKLRALIDTAAREHRRSLGNETIITPLKLPIAPTYRLPIGEETLDRLDAQATASDFTRHRHYATWHRGLFTAAKFDSFSAEYRVADLLDRSPSIRWWKRLYANDKAKIAYTTVDNYNPDFVAFDTEGYHWIIEGKGEDKRNDGTVELKRRAAEAVIPRMMGDPVFGEQLWAYAIAYESDVKNAESWDDLIASVRTVKTERY